MDQPTVRKSLIDDLVESDAGYFEAAAITEPVQGATITRMAGLESLAAGSVVQRIAPTLIPRDADGWLEDIEQRLISWGIEQARLYLHRKAPDLEAALTRRGYRARDEIVVMRTDAPAVASPNSVTLRQIETEFDWAQKLALHQEMEIGPDGHPAPADLWVSMERQKCEAGYMTPYLIVADDDVVGTANTAPWKGVLRLKNVAVVPQHRLRGIGFASVSLLADLATSAGKAAAGAFVVADAPFMSMYTHAGFEIVSRQTEWGKEFPTSR
jgi:GNAT superfamily N-acetyltransferase